MVPRRLELSFAPSVNATAIVVPNAPAPVPNAVNKAESIPYSRLETVEKAAFWLGQNERGRCLLLKSQKNKETMQKTLAASYQSCIEKNA